MAACASRLASMEPSEDPDSNVEGGSGQGRPTMSHAGHEGCGDVPHVLCQSHGVCGQGGWYRGGHHNRVVNAAGGSHSSVRTVASKAPPAGHLLEHGHLGWHCRK